VRSNAEVDKIEAYRVVVESDAEVGDLAYIEKAEVSEDAEVKRITRVDKLSVDLKCVDVSVKM
jgi:hypothetical protein